MIQRKSWLAGTLAALMALSMANVSAAVPPVTDGDPGATYQSVIDFSAFPTDVYFADPASDTDGWGEGDANLYGPDGNQRVTVERTDEGSRLVWTNKKTGGQNYALKLNYGKAPGALTDWTGATELWVKVDGSAYSPGKDYYLYIGVTDADGGIYWIKDGGVCYIEQDGAWVEKAATPWRNLCLPAGYTGWVRVPLNTETLFAYDWEKANDVFELDAIRQVHVQVDGTDTSADTTLYFDEIGIYGSFAAPVTPGDINGDDKVSTADARLALRAAVGKETLTTEQAAAADVNNDGAVTTTDARLILKAVVGKSTL